MVHSTFSTPYTQMVFGVNVCDTLKVRLIYWNKFAMRIQTVYLIRIYQIRFTRIKRSHIETESVPIFEFTIVFSSI